MHFFPGHNHYVTNVARSEMREPIDTQSGPTSLKCNTGGMDTQVASLHTEATRI